MSEILKQELDEKIRKNLGSNAALIEYFKTTFENFLYRYLETTSEQNIKIQMKSDKHLFAQSHESNMGEAFKISDETIKNGIKNLAKSVPREENPKVRYELHAYFHDFSSDHGKITLKSIVNWNFPSYELDQNTKAKEIIFEYDDVTKFRKELALKLEDACSLFL